MSRKPMSFTTRSLIGLGLGFAAGLAAYAFNSTPLLQLAGVLEPFGMLWVNALRMLVIPLVVSSLILGIADTRDGGSIGKTGGAAFGLFAAFLLLGTAYTLAIAIPVVGRIPFGPASLGAGASDIPGVAEARASGASSDFDLVQWLFQLVPTNPVGAAADGAILPLLVFSVPFAFAVSRIKPDSRAAFLGVVRGVCEAMFVFLRWVLWVAPGAVFILTFGIASRAGFSSIEAIGFFIALSSGLLLLFTLLLYPITAAAGGIGMGRFARGVAPAQTVAAGSRSSLASLPSLLEGARRIELPPAVAGLVLPLSCSTFKMNVSISSTTKFLFLAVVYDLALTPERMLTFITASLLLSVASPGLPTAPGSVTRLPAYMAAGIPLEGVMILSAVDTIPDIFKTILNVTANMSVAVIVSRWAGFRAPKRAAGIDADPAVSSAPATPSAEP
jgi:Na+/H+-dicarboxylate symporter